jgi:DNA helicase-2/ATP-dependent DNA helicase PcrA
VGPAQEKAATLYAPYQELLRRSNAMDFDDLLLKPIELFRGHPDVLERYRDRWRFIHVDEYQDTNHAQYVVTRLLADGHRNLCVVGDDAQSIYAFRGADIGNILSFQRDYPEATVVRLEQNYRSSKTIVRLADRIIRGNSRQIEKKLWTDNEEGEPVLVLEALSEKDEAQKVERRIRDLCLRRGLRYREVAVLYRTNAQSRSLEEAFRREDVPYRIVGGVSFYQRREIKDAIAYLRLVVNPDDGGSLRRIVNVPARGIGDRSQDLVFAFAEREGIGPWEALHRMDEIPELGSRAVNALSAFRDLVAAHVREADSAPAGVLARSLIHQSGLVEDLMRENTPENLVRRENIAELVSAIQEFTENPDTPDTLSAFLQEVSLLTDADLGGDDDDRVTLMTMHASKGLEFPAVFVTGLEEGLFPLSAAAQDPDELEEERRLFYVGTTRAERHLVLAYARTRYRYGEQQSCVRSRFLDELDGDLLRNEAGGPFEPKRDRFALGGVSEVRYDAMDPHYYRQSLRPDLRPDLRPERSVTTVPKPPPGERRIVYDEDQTGMVAAGMRVEHSLFGEGKVLAVEGIGPQAKATVFFPEVGQKKLILRFARLRRIG